MGWGAGAMLQRLWNGAQGEDSRSPDRQTPQRTVHPEASPQPGLVSRLWARGTAVAHAAVAPVPSPGPATPTASEMAMDLEAPITAAASVLDVWSEDQVCEWLVASDAAFEQYLGAFRDNHIDGRALGLLTREDLADLGVKSVGHRLAILRARADLGLEVRPANGNHVQSKC